MKSVESIMKWIAPSRLLVVGGLLSTAMALCVSLRVVTGYPLLAALVLVSTFMSLMFPSMRLMPTVISSCAMRNNNYTLLTKMVWQNV